MTTRSTLQDDFEFYSPSRGRNASTRGRLQGAQANASSEVNLNQVREFVESTVRFQFEGLQREIGNIIERQLQNVSANQNRSDASRDNNIDVRRPDLPLNHYNNLNVNDQQLLAANNGTGNHDIVKKILNWKITFDGTNNNLSVDEFIYRIETLTRTNLQGNFQILCDNAHVLFVDRASRWFWRVHQLRPNITWAELSASMKQYFKDHNTDTDLKNSIRNRKQRNNESFESYLEAILSIADRIRNPMSEEELVSTIMLNLHPDVRLELLHFDIKTISELRRVCKRRENFFSEINTKYPNYKAPSQRARIAEVDFDDTPQRDSSVSEAIALPSVDAIAKKDVVCWNCDEANHTYKTCVKPRRVFCYRCGLLAHFLPTCPRCNDPENLMRGASSSQKYPQNKNRAGCRLSPNVDPHSPSNLS